MYSILFLAATSFLCCYLLTPVISAWSVRRGLVDRPNRRKTHALPTPRTGGIAIALSYAIALAILVLSPLNAADSVNLPFVVKLLPAAAVVFGVGLIDDLVGLRPWEKLLGQTFAAAMAYAAGVTVAGFAGYVAPDWAALPITVLWLVACANAFNLIDGVDGLAAGVGLFAATTTLLAALLQHNPVLALATAPLAGALLAFLRYNFNPASIFLGDCGSLTIGFALGCFGAIWSQKSATVLGMTAPLMALSIPLLDTTLAVVRRYLRHQPIFSPDRNHIHHRLLDRGFTPRKVALVMYAVCGVAAAFSLLQTMPKQRFESLLLILFSVAVWVGVQLVGYAEFDTAKKLVLTGTFRHILHAKVYVEALQTRMARNVTAEECWGVVREIGREFGCSQVRMSVGATRLEEGEPPRDGRECTIRIPFANGGTVEFVCARALSVRQAVAFSSIVEVWQRVVVVVPPDAPPVLAATGAGAPARPVPVARRRPVSAGAGMAR